MLRVLKWVGIGFAALVVAALIPVVFTETVCNAPVDAQAEPFKSVLDPADRREEVNTYLTYPEWSIVHAYEDFAAGRARAANPISATSVLSAAIGRTYAASAASRHRAHPSRSRPR
jgi:hypothetical protein